MRPILFNIITFVFNGFLGARIYKFLSKFCILYKTSINDEFNKTFRKSFLLMKNQVNRQKLMFGEVSYFLRGSNFRILVIFFNTYYFHTFTFNKHENRTWTQIGLFWWEGRVGGRNNLGIFQSHKEIFRFLPLGKDPPPFRV